MKTNLLIQLNFNWINAWTAKSTEMQYKQSDDWSLGWILIKYLIKIII